MNTVETHQQPKRFLSAMIVLTPSLVERLDATARRETTSRSQLIRQACEAFLKQAEAREADHE